MKDGLSHTFQTNKLLRCCFGFYFRLVFSYYLARNICPFEVCLFVWGLQIAVYSFPAPSDGSNCRLCSIMFSHCKTTQSVRQSCLGCALESNVKQTQTAANSRAAWWVKKRVHDGKKPFSTYFFFYSSAFWLFFLCTFPFPVAAEQLPVLPLSLLQSVLGERPLALSLPACTIAGSTGSACRARTACGRELHQPGGAYRSDQIGNADLIRLPPPDCSRSGVLAPCRS